MPAEVPLVIFMTVVVPIFVVGCVIATWVYLRSREKQLLINQGVPPEQIAEMWKRNTRSNPYLMLKIGVIVAFFGFALLVGNVVEEWFDTNDGVPIFIVFMFLGLGIIAASLIGKRLEERDREIEERRTQQ
jgi:Na+/glutamate symporter